MNKLVRFGVSMENDLLHEFDHLITHKGYNNRSEAVRDIVRDALVEESIQMPDGVVYGALVFLYDHHKRELEKSLSNLQHTYFENIISKYENKKLLLGCSLISEAHFVLQFAMESKLLAFPLHPP